MNGISGVIWIVAVIFIVIWIAGLVASSTFGGLLHVLLILAVVAVVIELIRPKRN